MLLTCARAAVSPSMCSAAFFSHSPFPEAGDQELVLSTSGSWSQDLNQVTRLLGVTIQPGFCPGLSLF